MQTKLEEITYELRSRLHDPVPEGGQWLRSVLIGHMRDCGVPMNAPALYLFRYRLIGHGWRALKRRSHKSKVSRERMQRFVQRWLPPVQIHHPYPLRRRGVIT